MHLKYLIPFFLTFLSVSFADAQEPFAIHINQTNGLPSNAVYQIYQDTKGYIWFATQEGLTRYDGFAFKTYKCDEQVSTAGSCIKEDAFGRIWYENFDGSLYYVWHDTLFALAQKSVFNFAPFAITRKHLMIVHLNSIDVYDLKTLSFVQKITIPSTTNFFESSFAIGDDFYFVLNDLIYRLGNDLKITRSDFLANKVEKIKQVYAADSIVFVLSKLNNHRSLYTFDRNLNHPETLPIPHPQLIQGANFIDGKFWIHTVSGTYVYNHPDDSSNEHTVFLKGKSVSGVLKDRQGNYWFSTTSDGAYLIPDLKNKLYPTKDFSPLKITQSSLGFLLANKEGLFLNFKPDQNFGQKTEIKATNSNVQSELYYLYTDKSSDDIIYSARGMTIIPKLNFSSAREYDVALKEIVRIDSQYYAFAANGFCGLIKTPDFQKGKSSVWDSLYQAGLGKGLNIHAKLVENIRGRCISFDKKYNTIYCSGNKGFYKITPYATQSISMNGSPFYASKIVCCQGRLYALNTKGNFYQIEKEKQFILLNSKFGIAEHDIKYLRQFDSILLLVSSRLIHYVNLNTLNHHILKVTIAPSAVSDLYLKDSSIYFVTKAGIVESRVDFGHEKSNQTLFRINGFVVNDITQQDFQNKTFDYRQNDISIHFSLLDFGSVPLQSLFYKLNEEDWRALPQESRNLQFKALSPGQYNITFKLGEKLLEQKVVFTIDSPFWSKWWFIFICISILALSGYSYYRWQISLLSRQIRLLNEKVALEQSLGKSILTSIKSQMNPHFFYNALNTIQAYIFTNDKRNASIYLSKFSKLTRMILEMSEQEFISLQAEIQALTLYLELEKMRFDDDFEFELKVDHEVDVEMIKIPSMLIQPYAENAIKHGLMHRKGNKHLSIQIVKEAQFLKVIIDDNGIGRDKSEEMKKVKKEKYTSFSTRANEQRLEILNRNSKLKVVLKIEDKMDENNRSLGTRVCLFIPIEL